MFAGEEDQLKLLILEAVGNTQSLIERLESACATRSGDVAVQLAHELKGLARTVGAEELGAIAERSETAARAGAWEEQARCLTEARAAHERFAKEAASLGRE